MENNTIIFHLLFKRLCHEILLNGLSLLSAERGPPVLFQVTCAHAPRLDACVLSRRMQTVSVHAHFLGACSLSQCMRPVVVHAPCRDACSLSRCMLPVAVHAPCRGACALSRCVRPVAVHAHATRMFSRGLTWRLLRNIDERAKFANNRGVSTAVSL